MITYVKGELSEIYGNYIVVETGGVGYEMMVPPSITGSLPPVGSAVKIYTFQYVREDALDLYGFLSRDDLDVFRLLITVNGIGPKGALNILSVITPDELRLAVLSDDVKKIQSAPGIGAKTAQKLIIELKDKLSLEDVFARREESAAQQAGQNGPRDEAIEALVALGYSSSEAIRAVRETELPPEADGEAVLKAALRKLAFM